MKILKSKRSKIWISTALALVLCLGSLSVYFIERSQSATALDNPISSVTKPKVKTTESTLPIPQLPQPQDSPTDPYEDVPVVDIGKIEIPKIGLSTTLYEGVWLTVLNVGPGHWPGTAGAGEFGNMVIAGHRVTHSKPFRNIDKLVNGDEIIVTSSKGKFTYKVTGNQIVVPKDIWIVDQTPGYRITLFACHPPGSARQRYVIYGDLVNPPS